MILYVNVIMILNPLLGTVAISEWVVSPTAEIRV